MRLIDLDPDWVPADGRERMGIIFQCPACLSENRGHGQGHFVAVYFENPPDGGPPASHRYLPSARWNLVGEVFERMSITPSIRVVVPECWHGWVTAGQVT